MPGQTGYSALVDTLSKATAADSRAFLMALRTRYQLGHILYADAEWQGDAFRAVSLLHDANPPLARLIRQQGVAPLAPLFSATKSLFGPGEIDPAAIKTSDRRYAQTLATCGLDRPMLVFPLLPSRPGVAFFACTSIGLDDWPMPVEILFRDIAALAGLFHAKRLSSESGTWSARKGPHLTPREAEILQWVAKGKTYWEIAQILGISIRTVRHFMANCREKLHAVSNKQAVAKAVANRMIDIPEATFPPRNDR